MSAPKIKRKKENMEQPKAPVQLSKEQLDQAMENYQRQKAQEQEQQAQSEFKVWQLNIFKERSDFWKKIYSQSLSSTKSATEIADAALEQWDDRFLPKPPVQQEEELKQDAPVQ